MRSDPKAVESIFRGKRAAIAVSIGLAFVAFGYFFGRQSSMNRLKATDHSVNESGATSNRPGAESGSPSEKHDPLGVDKSEVNVRKPLPLESLPPVFLKQYQEAQEFINRIPEMERELLSQNPLLQKAIELSAGLEGTSQDVGGNEHQEKAFQEWVSLDGRNFVKADLRESILKLDVYLELIDDPDYAPFINDGITDGWLSLDLPELLRRQLEQGSGLVMEGVEAIPERIADVGQFREELRRFAKAIKSKPENFSATEPLPDGIEELVREKSSASNKKLILRYYQQSILPKNLVEERSRHYRAVRKIRANSLLKPTPPEINDAFKKLISSPILSSRHPSSD